MLRSAFQNRPRSRNSVKWWTRAQERSIRTTSIMHVERDMRDVQIELWNSEQGGEFLEQWYHLSCLTELIVHCMSIPFQRLALQSWPLLHPQESVGGKHRGSFWAWSRNYTSIRNDWTYQLIMQRKESATKSSIRRLIRDLRNLEIKVSAYVLSVEISSLTMCVLKRWIVSANRDWSEACMHACKVTETIRYLHVRLWWWRYRLRIS